MTAVITGTDNLDILQYSKDKSLTFTDYDDVVEVQFKKGKNAVLATTINNGVALIPNQLLSGEVAGKLKFQVVNSEGNVLYENYLSVLKDNIPVDYVLNHTVCKTYYYRGRANYDKNTMVIMNYTSDSISSLPLTSVDISNLNTQNITDMNNMFYSCNALASLTLGPDWGSHTKIKTFDLSACPLTYVSCIDVFNKLADKTKTATPSATLSLSSTTKALMSKDEIKIATDKGWTVS